MLPKVPKVPEVRAGRGGKKRAKGGRRRSKSLDRCEIPLPLPVPRACSDMQRVLTAKKRKLWAHYGLNEAMYDEMFERQEYSCGICKEPLSQHSDGCVVNYERVAHYKDLPPAEKRKHVRALLCRSCDAGLRMFRGSETALIDAVVFLRTH